MSERLYVCICCLVYSPYADLCRLTTLIGVHVQQVNSGHVNSGVLLDKDDDCEQSDLLSSEKSSHKGHLDLPMNDSDFMLLDTVSPSLGCLDMTESGMGRRKKRLTKQQRRHTKWGKQAVTSSDHTSHGTTTTVDTPLLTYSRRRVSHESLEPSKKREDGVHGCGKESKESDSSLLLKHKCTVTEDEMEKCGSEQQTLKLIVSLPRRTVEHKTVGESSDQDSSHTGTHRGRLGMQCVRAGEGHILDQEALDEEVNALFKYHTYLDLFLYHPACTEYRKIVSKGDVCRSVYHLEPPCTNGTWYGYD